MSTMQLIRCVLVVLDSQVLYSALGKGRSPARILNRMALLFAENLYIFLIWTLSAWNYVDKPSHE